MTNWGGTQVDNIVRITLQDSWSLNESLESIHIGRNSGSGLVYRGKLYFWFESKGEKTAVSLEVGLNDQGTPITITY